MEEDDEFGPLYFDVLKPFSSFHQTHNFKDRNPLNFNIQSTNLTTNLKNIDGILVTGGDDCNSIDNLVFDVENEQKEEEMDSMVFNVERRNHNKLHLIGDLKNSDGFLLIGGEDCDIDHNLVLDVENEQKGEEMDSVVFNGGRGKNDLHLIDLKNNDGAFAIEREDGEIADDLVFDLENEQKEEQVTDSMVFNVEKRDHNELHVIGDLMDEQIGDLEIDMGIDNLENNDGILLTGVEDGEIADNLVFDVENEQNEAGKGSTSLNVGKWDHNELHVIEDLTDEKIGNMEIDMGIDNLELGEKIPGLSDSSFFEGLLENENGVELGDLNTNNNCGNGEGFDEDCESEEGLTIILNDNLDDFDMEEESGHNSTELVDGKKRKENIEAADGYGELGNDADQSSHTKSKGVRAVPIPEIAPTDPRRTPVQVHAGHGRGTRLNYQLPYRKTVFDINIDDFDDKPWRHPGVDVSRFFNFGLDEEKWKDYCKKMVQLRLQISLQSNIISSKSGKSKPVKTPIRRGIRVDVASSERVASIEDNLPKLCDSNAIIEIVFLESVDDTDLYIENIRTNIVHKNINGDGILPFPLDGSCQHTPHEERGSQHLSNDEQEGRQMTDLKSMVIKRKDYHSYQDHSSNPAIYFSMHLDNLKERRMTGKFPQKKRLKYDERKLIHSNKIRYDTKGNYDVHFTERKRMEGWNSSDGDHLPTYSREFLDEPCARRENNEEYTTVWNMLNDHQSVNCRDDSWRQRGSNYRQRLKQSANVYDNQGGTNKSLGTNTNIFKMVHQNYHYRNNGNYKFSKSGGSEQDTNSPPMTDPADFQEKKVSDNQNAYMKQTNDVIFCEQNRETDRGHIKLAEDSPKARVSDVDERDNDLIMEINDFVREINDLVDSHNHDEGEMIKVEEVDEKLKE